MTKIGVVSDTHSLELPAQMLKDFKNVDMIIHAGDFSEIGDVNVFRKMKTFHAVHGNQDDGEVRGQFPRKQIIQCGDVAIGLFHGEGPRKQVLNVVKDEFKKDNVNMVIFGHTHEAFHEVIDGVLYFNPGSPNDTLFAPFCSYGLIEIAGAAINANIIKVK